MMERSPRIRPSFQPPMEASTHSPQTQLNLFSISPATSLRDGEVAGCLAGEGSAALRRDCGSTVSPAQNDHQRRLVYCLESHIRELRQKSRDFVLSNHVRMNLQDDQRRLAQGVGLLHHQLELVAFDIADQRKLLESLIVKDLT